MHHFDIQHSSFDISTFKFYVFVGHPQGNRTTTACVPGLVHCWNDRGSQSVRDSHLRIIFSILGASQITHSMNIEEQLKNVRTANGESLYKVQLKKARLTALVLASATIISLIFLAFAFVQKERARKLEAELARQQLETCLNSK
jgi:hypothetical protein